MSDELVNILQILVSKLGMDCLNQSNTWRYIDDYAPQAASEDKRKLKMAFKSQAFDEFYVASDINKVATKLKNETFWSDDVVNDVVQSFAKVMGITIIQTTGNGQNTITQSSNANNTKSNLINNSNNTQTALPSTKAVNKTNQQRNALPKTRPAKSTKVVNKTNQQPSINNDNSKLSTISQNIYQNVKKKITKIKKINIGKVYFFNFLLTYALPFTITYLITKIKRPIFTLIIDILMIIGLVTVFMANQIDFDDDIEMSHFIFIIIVSPILVSLLLVFGIILEWKWYRYIWVILLMLILYMAMVYLFVAQDISRKRREEWKKNKLKNDIY